MATIRKIGRGSDGNNSSPHTNNPAPQSAPPAMTVTISSFQDKKNQDAYEKARQAILACAAKLGW